MLFLLFLFLLKVFLSVLRHFKAHASKFRCTVFVVDRFKFRALRHIEVKYFFYKVFCTLAQFWLFQMCIFLNRLSPNVFVSTHFSSEIEGTSGKDCWTVLNHGIRRQTSFHHVLSEPYLSVRWLCQIRVPLKESERTCDMHFKLKWSQNILFHLEDLTCLVGVVSYVNNIRDDRWINLFIFTSN